MADLKCLCSGTLSRDRSRHRRSQLDRHRLGSAGRHKTPNGRLSSTRSVLLVEWSEALEASRASAKQWLWTIRYACSTKQYWPALGWPEELSRGRNNFLI